MISDRTPPADLCVEHAAIWKYWAAHDYNWRHPCEWPGMGPIMDSRTTHADREAGWDRKNREQMDLTADICRGGRSPQCIPPKTYTLTKAEIREMFG